jgi:hypothetical protein
MARKLALAVLVLSQSALAQKEAKEAGGPPDMAERMALYEKLGAVTENHRVLEALVGEWTTTSKMFMDPASPPEESSGTCSSTLLFDGRFVQGNHHGEFMGKPFHGIGTTGYDNAKQKYVGTWMDSMSTGIMTAEGTYDAAKKTFTFTGAMADPMTGGETSFRYTYNISNRDRIVFEWFETHEGKEMKSMELVYTRKRGS